MSTGRVESLSVNERGRGGQGRAAANRVRLAIAGFGARGLQLVRRLASLQGVELVAVADPYDGRGRRARELAGDKLQVVRDGRQVIDRPDVDAVLLATPDHWHAPLLVDALAAGKDVYVECPVTHSTADDERIAAALAGTKQIVQSGGGWITSPVFLTARRLIGEGRLGRVTLVRATWDTTTALEAWQTPFPPDASPASIDFATFLGPAPKREFDPARFFRWRCYRDYGSGLAGARLAPMLTAIHWLLDLGEPAQATATGARQRWKDDRQVPDVVHATLRYDTGVTVNLGATQNGGSTRELRVTGTEATLVLDDDGLAVVESSDAEPYEEVGETWSKEYRDWFYMMHGMSPQGLVRGAPPPERAVERYRQPEGAATAAAHLADFLDSVRTRRPPAEPLTLGRAAARIARQLAGQVSADGEAR